MVERIFASRFGPLLGRAAQRADGSWVAVLVHEHPRLGAVAGAVGEEADQALARLAHAVSAFGCDWPRPRQRDLVDEDGHEYVRASDPEQVMVTLDDEDRAGYAVGWRGREVWVCWARPAGNGLDTTSWVRCANVRRSAHAPVPQPLFVSY